MKFGTITLFPQLGVLQQYSNWAIALANKGMLIPLCYLAEIDECAFKEVCSCSSDGGCLIVDGVAVSDYACQQDLNLNLPIEQWQDVPQEWVDKCYPLVEPHLAEIARLWAQETAQKVK